MDCGSIRGIADEADCGIAGFVNWELKPIGGALKSFPEDFVVKELPLLEPESGDEGEEEKPFLRFRLKKRGLDTLEAVDALASACHIPPHRFGFAGIKDSFAVTTQELTVPRHLITEAGLRKAAANLPGLRVGRVRRSRQPLVPGRLRGNRFILRVRGIRANADEVKAAVESLQTQGFINYVGMQRFGKGGVRSDLLGLAYLQGDYIRCVDILLRQRGAEKGSARMPRWAEVYQRTNSAEAALRKLPEGSCWAERRLLRALHRRQDLDGGTAMPKWSEEEPLSPPKKRMRWADVAREAFLALPRTIRALYAHSYVDRLWNLAATERRQMGLRLVQGDWIDDPAQPGTFRPVISEDDVSAEAKQASIFDLVLPRPGAGVSLPSHGVGHFMRSYLAYDGLDPEELMLEAAHTDDPMYLTGCMRRVLVRPGQLSWYLEPNLGTPDSDWPDQPGTKVSRATNCFSRVRAKHDLDGSKSLVLDFHLGPGQYATMAMREVMRPRPPKAPPRHTFFSDTEEETQSMGQCRQAQA
ncbi:Pus7, partial [Symbiodinium pilosum]